VCLFFPLLPPCVKPNSRSPVGVTAYPPALPPVAQPPLVWAPALLLQLRPLQQVLPLRLLGPVLGPPSLLAAGWRWHCCQQLECCCQLLGCPCRLLGRPRLLLLVPASLLPLVQACLLLVVRGPLLPVQACSLLLLLQGRTELQRPSGPPPGHTGAPQSPQMWAVPADCRPSTPACRMMCPSPTGRVSKTAWQKVMYQLALALTPRKVMYIHLTCV
jgi:hypothetical protein